MYKIKDLVGGSWRAFEHHFSQYSVLAVVTTYGNGEPIARGIEAAFEGRRDGVRSAIVKKWCDWLGYHGIENKGKDFEKVMQEMNSCKDLAIFAYSLNDLSSSIQITLNLPSVLEFYVTKK